VMPPATYNYKDNIVEIELSEYAGYAGLIYANGGLEPTENSYFFKTYGFKLKITLSEATTGRRSTPASSRSPPRRPMSSPSTRTRCRSRCRSRLRIRAALTASSSGVRETFQRLKGKVLVASQFGESEFFLRYPRPGSEPSRL